MIGAIIGDIIGSAYESSAKRTKKTDFIFFDEGSRFTDDTVLTVATIKVLLNDKNEYANCYKELSLKYPDAGYGSRFIEWMNSKDLTAYSSYGNGSAMRVSPIGFFFDDIEETIEEARKSAEVTHNHEEGIKGAEAVASSVFMARKGFSKKDIRKFIQERFGYNLEKTINEIRPSYVFDVSCQGSVPEAIISFLDSKNYEDSIRLAVSLGGDSDTIACITGGISEAFYKNISRDMISKAWTFLPKDFKNIITDFYKKHG